MRHGVEAHVGSPDGSGGLRILKGPGIRQGSQTRREAAFSIEEDYSNFDWDATDADQFLPPLPEGWYPVRIVKAQVETIDGKEDPQKRLRLEMRVLEGNCHEGRAISDGLLLDSKRSSRRRRAIIWNRLGLVQSGTQKAVISVEGLIGREIAVHVCVVDYVRRDGTRSIKNEVAFAGYGTIGEIEQPKRTGS